MSTTLSPVRRRPGPPAASGRGVLRLPVRLARRGALLLCTGVAVYTAIEVVTYRSTYPDAASREQVSRLADSAAVRVLQGTPHAVDTVGGFVVWDAGWFLSLLIGVWALLLTTRLLRGEEDDGRSDLLLARPLPSVRLLLTQLSVVGAAVLLTGAVVAGTLVATGVGASGAVLFGAGLAGFGLVTVATAALASQLLEPRRRAVSAALGVLGASFAVRMVAGSEPGREGLLWLTPSGWVDLLEPYSARRWPVLLLPLATSAVLVSLAARERARRDAGAARLSRSDRRAPRPYLLGSATAFGWRSGQGALLAWAVGTFGFGLVMGALVQSVVELVQEDDQYRRMLEDLGVDATAPADGFLAAMALVLALAFVLQVCFRLGAVRAEEVTGRLEHLLVRPLGRRRWLLATVALTVVAAGCVVLASALGVAAGGLLTGAGLGAGQVAGPFAATLPVVVLFTGLAVLVLGALPRLTVALPATLAVAAYLLQALGPALELPQAVIDASPFAWLPTPPTEPWTPGPALVLTLVGLAGAVAGAELFARRDLTGD